MGTPHPSVAQIARVARALGDVADEVVFIGGAIAPLLQSDPVLPRIRPTDDVDAIVASTGYSGFNRIEERLRALGFRTEIADRQHIHRWRAPDGTAFDLVPAGDHLGGTGAQLEQRVISTALTAEVGTGLQVRHASAPGFLALKWAAYWDRGAGDPFRSEDLEDILALLVSRDGIVEEVRAAPAEVIEAIRKGVSWLISSPDYDDLVAACLVGAAGYAQVARRLRERLGRIVDTTA